MASLVQPLCQRRYHQVRLLIQLGVSLDQRQPETRKTPVMLCTEQPPTSGALSLMRMLLARGADAAAVDRDGRNVLGVAILADNVAAVRLLLSESHLDLDLNHVDSMGLTPLTLAVQMGSIVMVKMLVAALRRNHMSVDRADRGGMTPLMVACKLGRPDIALVLVRSGKASLSMRDNVRFWSPEEWLKGSELAVLRPDLLDITTKAFRYPVATTRVTFQPKHSKQQSVDLRGETKKLKHEIAEPPAKLDEVMTTDYKAMNYIQPKIGSLALTTGNVHVRQPLSRSRSLNVRSNPDIMGKQKLEVKIPIKIKVGLNGNNANRYPGQVHTAERPLSRSKSAKIVRFQRERPSTAGNSIKCYLASPRESPNSRPASSIRRTEYVSNGGASKGSEGLLTGTSMKPIGNVPSSAGSKRMDYAHATSVDGRSRAESIPLSVENISRPTTGSSTVSQAGFHMLYSIYSTQHSASYRKAATPPPKPPTPPEPEHNEKHDHHRHSCSGRASVHSRGSIKSGSKGKLTCKKIDNIMELMLGRKKKSSLLSMLTAKSEGASASGSGKGWGKLKLGALAHTKSEPIMKLPNHGHTNKHSEDHHNSKDKESKASNGQHHNRRRSTTDASAALSENATEVEGSATSSTTSGGGEQANKVSALLRRLRAAKQEQQDSPPGSAESSGGQTGRGTIPGAPGGADGSKGSQQTASGVSSAGGVRGANVSEGEVQDESITRCESAEPLHHNGNGNAH